MKKRKLLSLCLIVEMVLLLFSCGQKNSGNNRTDTGEEKKYDTVTDNRYVEARKLNGIWVSQNFINEVIAKKSVYHAEEEMFCIEIDEDEILSDSPYWYGYSDMESGYQSPLKFDIAKERFVNDVERCSEYEDMNEPFELYVEDGLMKMYFPEKKEVDVYCKMEKDFHTEMQKILIEGNYGRVRFYRDGTVSNFKDYQYYSIIDNFQEYESDEFEGDIIEFYKNRADSMERADAVYEFMVKGDTLIISSENSSKAHAEADFKKESYKFIKRK